MVSVFISGSRQIDILPEATLSRLDNMINGNLNILLGDSEKGADNLVANYLFKADYPKVNIYSVYPTSRIKPTHPNWLFRQVELPTAKPAELRKLQTVKDREMANSCDFGLVIWQDTYTNARFKNTSVSAGSLRNIIQMLLNGKPVTLYHRKENAAELDSAFSHYQLNNIMQFEEIITRLPDITQRRFESELETETKLFALQQDATETLALF